MDLKIKLLILVFIMTSLSILLLIVNTIKLQPIPIQSLEVANGAISYYSSVPTSMSPGLIIRVYAINGSSTYAVPAFIAVYGLTPRHITPIAYGYGSVINVPFSNTDWLFVANKWLSFNPSINEYDTSLLIFITYIDFTENRSWIEAYSVPYNIGWIINSLGKTRYIVLTAYVNLSTKSFRLALIRRSQTNQPIINLTNTSSVYTEYNCLEQATVTPEISNEPQIYKPVLYCYGFTGPIPLVWVTWGKGILNEYKNYGLNLLLIVSVYGEISWYAISYESGQFTTIGISYNEAVNWGANTGPILTNPVTNGSSAYVYYDGTFVIINYSEYVYNTHLNADEYAGQMPIVEVIGISTSLNGPLGISYDYGNGPISMMYDGLIALAEQELGYPVLNRSTVVTYMGWKQGVGGPGCTTRSPGQGLGVIEWGMPIVSIKQYHQLNIPELIYELITSSIPGSGMGLNSNFVFNGPALTIDETVLFIVVPTSNLNHVSWYVSLVNASNVLFNAPALGFIINATSYYQDPNNILNCEGALTLPK